MRIHARPVRTLTFLTDIILINVAFYVAHVLRYQLNLPRPPIAYHPFTSYIDQQIILNILIIATFWQYKIWQRRRGEFWADEAVRLVNATALGSAFMIMYLFLFLPEPFSRVLWVWVPICIVILLSAARGIRRLFLIGFYNRGWGVDHVLVIGGGETGRSLMRTLIARQDLGFKTLGYLHDGTKEEILGLASRIPNLGTFDNLASILRENPNLHTVFIALPATKHPLVMQLIRICQENNVPVNVAPDMFQLSLSQVEAVNMGGIPVLGVREVRRSPVERTLKRLFDLLVVGLAAFPLLLVGSIIALAIKLESAGPIFYGGERVGREGEMFKMWKFRSMVVDAESQKAALAQMNEAEGPIFKIREDPRLTRVGRFIRRLSLDELPQFYNVLVGEMSLVGPRPPVQPEVDQYKPWHRQRLAVRGGITGLWQVSGRADLTFDEQCLLDIYYIENWSFGFDLRILFQTIPYALFGRGAY